MNSINSGSLIKFNRHAVVIWFLFLVPSILIAFLTVILGMHAFKAAGLANRLYAFLLLVFFFNSTARILLKPNYFVIILFFYSIFGLFNWNRLGDVIVDFFLLVNPLIFYNYSKKIKNIDKFLFDFFKLNLFSLVISKITGFSLYYDLILLLSYSVIYFNRILVPKNLLIWLFVLFSVIGNKTSLILLMMTQVFKNVRVLFLKFLGAVPFIAFFVFILIQFSEFLREIDGINKFIYFARFIPRLLDVQFTDLLKNPESIFLFLDTSTAQRVFEFLLVFNSNLDSFLNFLFGKGLGAVVDLKESKDASVHASRDSSVTRIFHLGVTWVFAKFGGIGVVGYFMGPFVIIRKGIRYVRHNPIRIVRFSVLYLILTSIGMFFTFAPFLKSCVLGLVLFVVFSPENLVNRYENR